MQRPSQGNDEDFYQLSYEQVEPLIALLLLIWLLSYIGFKANVHVEDFVLLEYFKLKDCIRESDIGVGLTVKDSWN